MCNFDYCLIACCTKCISSIVRRERGSGREMIGVAALLALSVVSALPFVTWATLTPAEVDGYAPARQYGTDPPARRPARNSRFSSDYDVDVKKIFTIWTVPTMLPVIMVALSFTCLAVAFPMASTWTPRQCLIVISFVAVVLQGISATTVLIKEEDDPRSQQQSGITAGFGLILNLVSQVLHGVLLVLMGVHRAERLQEKVMKTSVPVDPCRQQVYGGVSADNVELSKLEDGAAPRRMILQHSTVRERDSCVSNVPNLGCKIALLLDIMAFWLPWGAPAGIVPARKLWQKTVLNVDIAMVAGVFSIVVGLHVEGDELRQASIFLFSLGAHLWAITDMHASSTMHRSGAMVVVVATIWILGSVIMLLRKNGKNAFSTAGDLPQHLMERGRCAGVTEAWGNAGDAKPGKRGRAQDLVVGRPVSQQRMENA